MKVPVQCPHGCGYTLELDMTQDHQHIQCHECACTFCAVCVEVFAVSVQEAERMSARSKAHLN